MDQNRLMRIVLSLVMLLAIFTSRAEPFQSRGYYLTMMRMPVMGLPEWKQAVDCFADDGANTLIFWTAGGFKSKKFPITWQYNSDHANITNDFMRELIDYAHTKKIRVLLGFTPFGYDGVNRYALQHPELKARKADGTVVDEFGIHSWGWNLCASKEESQRFMREYISEMVFDFYPNADGLLIESSDYKSERGRAVDRVVRLQHLPLRGLRAAILRTRILVCALDFGGDVETQSESRDPGLSTLLHRQENSRHGRNGGATGI
jgi:hypothetical protein